MLPDSAFMTEGAKAAELWRYQEYLKYWEEQGFPVKGGVGWPDPEMLPWVEKINRIDGLCTLQSCSGHANKDKGHWAAGRLWLWMAREKWEAFQGLALDLAQEPTIERVASLYQPYGRVVIDLTFEGLACGTLEESMDIILKYLQSM